MGNESSGILKPVSSGISRTDRVSVDCRMPDLPLTETGQGVNRGNAKTSMGAESPRCRLPELHPKSLTLKACQH